ncbi:MAG: response regulator [Acidobacteria bacterium]|nr:response regulator [Acidobacteriota bacterium]
MPTKRILCVDDDASTCELLTTMLGFSDLEAISALDVDEALQKIKSEKFSLYILDSQMPSVAGLSLCEQVRELDKDTPIIIFSGRARQTDLDAAKLAGADAYLIKPDSSNLIDTVKRLLRATRDTSL